MSNEEAFRTLVIFGAVIVISILWFLIVRSFFRRGK